WIAGVSKVLKELVAKCKAQGFIPKALCISATSGTFVITDSKGKPIASAAMYNDGRAASVLGRAEKIINEANQSGPYLLANTPEFVIAALSGKPLSEIPTDTSHSLKIGLDLNSITWNQQALDQVKSLNLTLPKLVLPGTKVATISNEISTQLGVDAIPIYAGMTDGCTAQISAGGSSGSVTALGTTMVIKAVSKQSIKGSSFYSHLLPKNRFLAGGASNIGGISYKQFASDIDNWNQKATDFGVANVVTYPLPNIGERFPFIAPEMKKLISGNVKNDTEAFRAILEAIAFTERYSYELLAKAGADISPQIFTAGGGGKSKILSQIRATVLGRPVITLSNSGSDIGAAMLALAADQVGSDGDLADQLAKIKISHGETFTPSDNEKDGLERNWQEFLTLTAKYRS
ncbi:MAG: FGGY-family carbohydrate kinase, partial [Actinobacteria bacterium]|nr:FGGY-family carbohydrate kinase [Actinomycetota bacterium]